jgi:hypothetical protein
LLLGVRSGTRDTIFVAGSAIILRAGVHAAVALRDAGAGAAPVPQVEQARGAGP